MINPKLKKRQKIIRIVSVTVVGLIVIGWVQYNRHVYTPTTIHTEPTGFTVVQGDGSTIISHKLKEQGFIKSPRAFQLYTWKEGISSRLQIGEYTITPQMTLKDIAFLLFDGPQGPEERTLTFIEGWNNNQIAEYLEEQGYGTQDQFFNTVQKRQDWWSDYTVLDSRPRDRDLEGYLFPDTYRFFLDASQEEIIKKLVATMDKRITEEMRNDIARQGKTIHEILTLASILEREVQSAQDMRQVAGLFYNRLDIGMALQADSTVNYVTGKKNPQATFADLEVESPYNTYKYPGLPPGPIASPSLNAIMAAIYPAENDYLYFLTTPANEVIYNRTFEGHVQAKNKYYD